MSGQENTQADGAVAPQKSDAVAPGSDAVATSKPDGTITKEALRRQIDRTILGVGIVTALLFVAYALWFGWWNGIPAARDDAGTWGAFGDFLGGILNPLVAFCALYWLTRSIEIQREELAATKDELADTKKVLEEQSLTAEKQRFEDTFFALLDQHNAVLRDLTQETLRDNESFSHSNRIWNEVFSSGCVSLADAKETLRASNAWCGHYFRTLYQLLKLIAMRCPGTTLQGPFDGAHLASAPSADEKLYSNIVRGFLDLEMTQLLAINCYCADEHSDYWNYKCLVERYAFLEHVSFNDLEEESEIMRQVRGHYADRAFGDNRKAAEIKARGEMRNG